MIGDLLKKLMVALWQFFRYQLARLGGSRRAEPAPAELPDQGILSDDYRRPVHLNTSRRDVDSEEFQLNPVYQLWKQHRPRAHKWTHYFDTYQAIFGPHRHKSLRVLEIGIYQGASLRLWKRYFDNPETVIVGIDIDPTCAQFDSPREHVHVRLGDQADAVFLATVTREFGPFDLIIDDGSHHSSHLIQSFNHLFATALKDDGIYLAEDLHANYWTPWRDTQLSFLDLCKELMELMHAHYTQATLDEWSTESESEERALSVEVPMIATMIKEIRVFDSIVAVYKTRREYLPRVLNPLAD
jgi:SAM-dependent methyltransferase